MCRVVSDRGMGMILFNRKGQSLMLALVVLFIITFIGGIFIVMVARNIARAARSGERISADYLSDAGIRYADDQLTYGLDGADWRPMPTYPEVVSLLSQGEDPETKRGQINPETTAEYVLPALSDPDYYWLIRGFSRVTYGNGRFLLRVSYDPGPNNPISKFIKIESVGFSGVIDPNDPTTLSNHPPARNSTVKVAYKAIGITDYCRFVTNKDNLPDDMPLGTPYYTTSFGDGDLSTGDVTASAPIRVNGNLMWYGKNYIWLDFAKASDTEARRGDSVQVSGDIKHALEPADRDIPQPGSTLVMVNPKITVDHTDDRKNFTEPSAAWDSKYDVTAFDSSPDDPDRDIGNYRDGRVDLDNGSTTVIDDGIVRQGRPRQISRLEPPVLDESGSVKGINRYRELTRNSGEWRWNGTSWYNTGFYGWGDGIYIDNSDDIQDESRSYTLRGNWTSPGSAYWNGPYYIPPGVSIYLTPYDLTGKIDSGTGQRREPLPTNLDATLPYSKLYHDREHYEPCMILTRDNPSGEAKYNWYDEDGNIMQESGERLVIPYPKNGVIFAEGNVRIKGTLAPGQNLTVVSGGTIYVEGNLLKSPFYFDKTDPGDPWKRYETVDPATNEYKDVWKNSSVSLLARDYVCVNTTQFFGPEREVLMAGSGGYYFEVTPEQAYLMGFSFGVDPAVYTPVGAASQTPIELYACHTSARDTGASYINMTVNYPEMTALETDPFYYFDYVTAAVEPDAAWRYIYPLGDSYYSPALDTDRFLYQKEPSWELKTFGLSPLSVDNKYTFYTEPGVRNTIGFRLDQSVGMGVGIVDYLVSRVAVQPCDIRVEAMMYAQNGSFFVIPGEWFNPYTDDTQANFVSKGERVPQVVEDEFPFYRQPLDVGLTIYGAVSENIPASIGDNSAWMEKWGWIPPVHGNSADAVHLARAYRAYLDPEVVTMAAPVPALDDQPRRGLHFVYDPQLSAPWTVDPWDTATAWDPLTEATYPDKALRYDEYGRTLPATPRLPVSTQTLYVGEPL